MLHCYKEWLIVAFIFVSRLHICCKILVAVSYILLNMSSISYSGYFTFHIWIQSLADISDTIPKFRPKTHHTIRSHLTNKGK